MREREGKLSERREHRSLKGVGEGGQLNQDPSSKPGRMTAGCFKQISTVSTGHCHAEEGLFSVRSVKLARL
jgi:hypothetical protein